ncbi:hypothetical protein JCM8547_009329 [Rhodosporidiobolus lusitaniae]
MPAPFLRVFCVQFCPTFKDVPASIQRAEELIAPLEPGQLDLLVLPEMAFTGYCFKSREDVEPFIEDLEKGRTAGWARKTARRLGCYVLVGLPTRTSAGSATSPSSSFDPPPPPAFYNSLLIVSPAGDLVATYHKHFLYETDETWATPGPSFASFDLPFPPSSPFRSLSSPSPTTFQLAPAICMDLNPHKFTAPFTAFEFGSFAAKEEVDLVVASMAWLDSELPREGTEESTEGGEGGDRRTEWEQVSQTLGYWALRVDPILGNGAAMVCCNRVGREGNTVFTGSSCAMELADAPEVVALPPRVFKADLVATLAMHLAAALAPLPSSPPSSTPALPSVGTFVAPPSRRGPRDFKLPKHQPSSTAFTSTDALPSSRDPRAEFLPPVPPSALDILSSSPPLSPQRTGSSSTTSTSKRSIPIQKAPPIPTPHFMFQQAHSYPRRPKTADSQGTNASKTSLGKAFARVFGGGSNASSSSLRTTPSHSPAASTSSVQTTSTLATSQGGVSDVSKRMGVMDLAREKGRRAVNFIKKKLNSKTPANELPQTWEDYMRAYANYEVDVEDPPLPPQRIAADGAEPTPFQQRAFAAPHPHNEAERQNVVVRLDLFGTREKAAMNASQATLDITASPALPSSSASPAPPSSAAMAHTASATSTATSRSSYLAPSEASSHRNSSSGFSINSTATNSTATSVTSAATQVEVVQSLENHPVFRQLVARAKTVFDTRVGLLTVLDDDQQLFLATGGLPDGVESMPRDASFCSHAILGEERGLVVLDSRAQEEWRFANHIPSAHLGARFYAGVPIWARAGSANDPRVAIGTLCVLDDKPREEFTEAHRRVLRDFASQATQVIEAWVGERMAQKMARLHQQMPKPALAAPPALASPPLTPPPSAGFPSPASVPMRPKTSSGPGSPLPATPPASIHRYGSVSASSHSRRDSDGDSTSSSIPASQIVQPRRPTALSLGVTTDDPISALPREVQKQLDTAVKMLAKALELELVYVAALDLALLDAPSSTSSSSSAKLRILSSHGLPHPPPSFDPALHLKALRAPEGGLIYKNPRFVPSSLVSTYAAGILIPILEVRRQGYVLCGYSRSADKNFVQRDLTYFVRFAEGLEAACIRASKTSTAVAIGAAQA